MNSSTSTSPPSDAEVRPTPFNLIEQPWIEVVNTRGEFEVLSIREALKRAGEIRVLSSEIPTVNFAILRILLSVLYRAWDSEQWQNKEEARQHWIEKYQQGTVYDDAVERYLDEHATRFDIADPHQPFFQVAGLHTAKDEWKDLEILIPDCGGEGSLFSMRNDISSINAADAARFLAHCHAFDYSGIKSGAVGDPRVKGGKGYPMGIGWAGWLGCTTIHGPTLRETLMLNYLPYRAEAGRGDLPLWELPPLGPGPNDALAVDTESDWFSFDDDAATQPVVGQVALMTWPQRRIRLRWEGDQVTGVLVCNGDPVDYTVQNNVETMTPWRYSDPQSKKAKSVRYMPAALQPERPIWRSMGAILPTDTPEMVKSTTAGGMVRKTLPAATVEWVSELLALGYISADLDYTVQMVSMIYGTQSASYSSIAEDALVLPGALLSGKGERARETARLAVERVDLAAKAVYAYHHNLLNAVSGADPDLIGNLSAASLMRMYAEVDTPFRQWLSALQADDTAALRAALDAWTQQVIGIAKRIAREILQAQPPAVWAGRWIGDLDQPMNAATAERRLYVGLSKLRAAEAGTSATQGKDS